MALDPRLARLAPGRSTAPAPQAKIYDPDDRVTFVHRGERVTGKVVRVKKDGLVTVDVADSTDEDVGYVDVRPERLTHVPSSPPLPPKLYYLGDWMVELASTLPKDEERHLFRPPVSAWYASPNVDAPPALVRIVELRRTDRGMAFEYARIEGHRDKITMAGALDLYPTRPVLVTVLDKYGPVKRWVAGPIGSIHMKHGDFLSDPRKGSRSLDARLVQLLPRVRQSLFPALQARWPRPRKPTSQQAWQARLAWQARQQVPVLVGGTVDLPNGIRLHFEHAAFTLTDLAQAGKRGKKVREAHLDYGFWADDLMFERWFVGVVRRAPDFEHAVDDLREVLREFEEGDLALTVRELRSKDVRRFLT